MQFRYPLWTEGLINQLLGISLGDNSQLSACISQGSEKQPVGYIYEENIVKNWMAQL